MTTITHGTNGRIYFVGERGVATLARCTWLVEDGYDEDGELIVLDCGAPLTRLDADGWECAHGHYHHTYGSAAQQAEERAEAALELERSFR